MRKTGSMKYIVSNKHNGIWCRCRTIREARREKKRAEQAIGAVYEILTTGDRRAPAMD